jgi:hypothetical protein
MTRDEILWGARKASDCLGLGPRSSAECMAKIIALVDAATKDLRAELDHWKISTGYATPEEQYMDHLDAIKADNSRLDSANARIAELEAALEDVMEDVRSTFPHCTGCGILLNCQGETSREHAWMIMDENKRLKAELEAMRDAD